MLGTARRLTDVLATAPDGTLYRIERFVSDPDAYSALGTSRFDPKTVSYTHLTLPTSDLV